MQTYAPQVAEPIRFFDAKNESRLSTRWLFFPLDVLSEERKRQIEYLRAGGEELGTPCLLRYEKGFLPRAYIAPLEVGPGWLPRTHAPEGADMWDGMSAGGVARNPAMAYIPVYPGDALVNILRTAQNDQGFRKGIAEITPLIGTTWEQAHAADGSGILDLMDRLFFGDGREPTLRGLEAQIRAGKAAAPEMSQMADQMLKACEEARQWGMNKVEIDNSRLRRTPLPGEDPAVYSPLSETLIPQLEMPRQDEGFKRVADLQGQIGEALLALAGNQNNGGFDMEKFAQIMSANSEGIAKRVADEVAAKMGEAKSAKEPAAANAADYDLTGDRPEGIHHSTWARMRREAGLE